MWSCSEHKFDWPVNLAVANPSEGSPLAIVVGDDPKAVVLDMRTKAAVMHLKGHLDYSFAASWHPNEAHTVATGNQVLPLFCITPSPSPFIINFLRGRAALLAPRMTWFWPLW